MKILTSTVEGHHWALQVRSILGLQFRRLSLELEVRRSSLELEIRRSSFCTGGQEFTTFH